MSNVVPLQLTSAEGLFRDRLGLTPDKVKGVDPAKINNMDGFIENRADIAAVPWWGKTPEVTSMVALAKNSGVREVPSVAAADLPKIINIESAFQNCVSLDRVGALEIPTCTRIDKIFAGASINVFDGPITVAPSCSIVASFKGASFANPSQSGNAFASGTSVSNAYECFWGSNAAHIANIEDLNQVEAFQGRNGKWVSIGKLVSIKNCKYHTKGVSNMNTLIESILTSVYPPISAPPVVEIDLEIHGLFIGEGGYGRTSWFGQSNRQKAVNVTTIGPDLYTHVTHFLQWKKCGRH